MPCHDTPRGKNWERGGGGHEWLFRDIEVSKSRQVVAEARLSGLKPSLLG